MDEHTAPGSSPQDQETSPTLPAADTEGTGDSLPQAGETPVRLEPERASHAPANTGEGPLHPLEDEAASLQPHAAEEDLERVPAPGHQPPKDESATLAAKHDEPVPDTLQSATSMARWRWTRRQTLIAVGVAAGLLAIGGGTTLALLASPSTPGATQAVPSTATPAQPMLPTPATPLPLDQALQAWRTKHLTAARTQRFQHRQGSALVPLGVVEPTYPNPYNPYQGHVQGYLLGGTLVAMNQLFFYLGLESLDGVQFVGKFRVGPIDQSADHFGLLVTQQSTDDIEGGAADDPLVTLAPKAFSQALPALVGHCIVVDCIRQPLPAEADDMPQDMLLAINQQAKISDQFLQVDYEVIHHTPLGHMSSSKLAPIRAIIDPTPITYASAEDGARYPLMTQVVLRHTDQLYAKLVAGD